MRMTIGSLGRTLLTQDMGADYEVAQTGLALKVDASLCARRSDACGRPRPLSPRCRPRGAVLPGQSGSPVAARLGALADELTAASPQVLAEMGRRGVGVQIAPPSVTRGPLSDWRAQARSSAEARGISLAEWRRDRDSAIWQYATAGFAALRSPPRGGGWTARGCAVAWGVAPRGFLSPEFLRL